MHTRRRRNGTILQFGWNDSRDRKSYSGGIKGERNRSNPIYACEDDRERDNYRGQDASKALHDHVLRLRLRLSLQLDMPVGELDGEFHVLAAVLLANLLSFLLHEAVEGIEAAGYILSR